MNEINSSEIHSILYDLSKKYILPKYKNLNHNEIMTKNNSDSVTSVDIKIEEELKKKLCDILPNSLFVGEEIFSKNPKILNNYNLSEYCWTVDPIDGTSNYINGIDKFAVMIALSFKDKILQSWIYKPLSDDLFFAIKDNGCFNNNERITIKNDKTIQNSVGSISFKYWDDKLFSKMQLIKKEFKKINSYKCIGFEYIDIAKSYREFTILSKLSPWDHMPGILIVREAGGYDSYFDKTIYNHFLDKKNLVVASSNYLGEEIISLIKEYV
tara:strand:- start:158 stop:964 length:807 start_codon:yes stop_codon:yes gene_type:complete